MEIQKLLKINIAVVLFLLILVSPWRVMQAADPIKILLVPGHDDEIWGAQYRKVKEANMNVAVAKRVLNILTKDKRFAVSVTRTEKGYTKEFADYFSKEKEAIALFREQAKKSTAEKTKNGNFVEKTDNVPHNNAPEDTALKLYGINKWANDKGIDAVIHIHFNDYPRPDAWTVGKHSGYAIYVPDKQLHNWEESSKLGAYLATELEKKYHSSTYLPEKGGLVADQKLIALGSNLSLSASVRSVLIEYGYIYEKKFKNSKSRHQAYDTMAKLTAEGLKNYFFQK